MNSSKNSSLSVYPKAQYIHENKNYYPNSSKEFEKFNFLKFTENNRKNRSSVFYPRSARIKRSRNLRFLQGSFNTTNQSLIDKMNKFNSKIKNATLNFTYVISYFKNFQYRKKFNLTKNFLSLCLCIFYQMVNFVLLNIPNCLVEIFKPVIDPITMQQIIVLFLFIFIIVAIYDRMFRRK
jgi:hypothetical protein